MFNLSLVSQVIDQDTQEKIECYFGLAHPEWLEPQRIGFAAARERRMSDVPLPGQGQRAEAVRALARAEADAVRV